MCWWGGLNDNKVEGLTPLRLLFTGKLLFLCLVSEFSLQIGFRGVARFCFWRGEGNAGHVPAFAPSNPRSLAPSEIRQSLIFSNNSDSFNENSSTSNTFAIIWKIYRNILYFIFNQNSLINCACFKRFQSCYNCPYHWPGELCLKIPNCTHQCFLFSWTNVA